MKQWLNDGLKRPVGNNSLVRNTSSTTFLLIRLHCGSGVDDR